MPYRVAPLAGLKTLREVIELHDEAWDRSPGIFGLLRGTAECCVLLDDEGRTGGYAFVEMDRSRGFAELQDIVVAPHARGRGRGSLLLRTVMRRYPAIKLIARAHEDRLLAFYERLGFVRDFVIENYYEIGEDGARMSWSRPEDGEGSDASGASEL